MLTKRNKNAIIKKVPSRQQRQNKKTEELVMKLQTKKKKKQELLVFYFAQKKSKKVFLKNVEKVLTKKKRYSIIQNVPRRKQGTKKYIEK